MSPVDSRFMDIGAADVAGYLQEAGSERHWLFKVRCLATLKMS